MKHPKHTERTEAEIIALAKTDKRHFGYLYERYFPQIFRFVFMRLGGQEDLAGDLTQQTFIKAMMNMDRYEDRGFSFGTWLYRIAQNEVSMHFRKSKKSQEIPVDENRIKELADEAEIDGKMSIEDQDRLILLINELDQEHQDLIELRFFQQFSFKEIADIYNITEANAKMRTYRILERLAKKWKEKQ